MANLIIDPSVTNYRYGVTPLPTFRLNPLRNADWGASAGSISPIFNTSVTTLTPPNRTQTIVVGATSGTDSGLRGFRIFGTFPAQPNYPYDFEFDDKVIYSAADDGSVKISVKGREKRSWGLRFNNRTYNDYLVLRDFWLFHRKHIPFYYNDIVLNELRLVRFDSGIKVTPELMDRLNMALSIREV